MDTFFQLRLIEKPESGQHQPLTPATAPAGYAKTIAVCLWLQHQVCQYIRISLDEMLNNLSLILVDIAKLPEIIYLDLSLIDCNLVFKSIIDWPVFEIMDSNKTLDLIVA